jgi:uroporphyrinogen decarboxylase
LGEQVAVQGNLDPVALFAPMPILREKVYDVLRRAAGRPGHIFNLGHGILPGTPVENVCAVVEMVHEWNQS